MYPKAVVRNYHLLNKVYRNYISFQKQLASEIRRFPENKRPIRVLEIGSGSCITTRIILSAMENISLTSIDIDPRMLALCKQSLKRPSNLRLLEADALTFLKSQKHKAFDIVVSAFTIHNFQANYRQRLYKQTFRILKDGGLFLNADKFVSDNPFRQINALKFRIGTYIDTLISEKQFAVLSYWVREYIRDIQPNYVMKLTEQRRLLKQIGFSDANYIFKSEHEMLAIMKATKQSGRTRTPNSNKNVK